MLNPGRDSEPVAAVLSLALLVLYLSRWWTVGYAISIARAIAAWRVLTAA